VELVQETNQFLKIADSRFLERLPSSGRINQSGVRDMLVPDLLPSRAAVAASTIAVAGAAKRGIG
jgi:hypothetical protein